MFEFILPDLGEGIHEGEVLEWHVKVGDTIIEDEPLIDIETDKAAVSIPSPKGGIVMATNGEVGEIVYVGNIIVVIDDSGNGSNAVAPVAAAAETVSTPPVAATLAPAAEGFKARSIDHKVPAAPATRKLAREMGIDINTVNGSGPAGRVTQDDVKLHASGAVPASAAPVVTAPVVAPAPVPEVRTPTPTTLSGGASTGIPFLDVDPLPDYSLEGPVEIEKLRSIRRKVAHKMVTSKSIIPHVVHMDEADVTDLDALRKNEKSSREGQPGGRLTLLPFVIKAIISGLKNYPMFNSSLDPFREEIIYKKYYNMGIAVDSERGLIVPVIKNADHLSILGISSQVEDLAEAARTGNIDVSSLSGGTFTITNVGAIGGTGFAAAINYPEAGILGLGRAQDKAVVRNGEIVIRKMLPIGLSYDHRIADGAQAARFMTGIVKLLSNPNTLLLEG